MNNNSEIPTDCYLFIYLFCMCEIVTNSIVKCCFLFLYFVLLQLALEDPVHSVSLHQFVCEKLKAQQTLIGDPGFGILMETVDTELVRQLQEFLRGF